MMKTIIISLFMSVAIVQGLLTQQHYNNHHANINRGHLLSKMRESTNRGHLLSKMRESLTVKSVNGIGTNNKATDKSANKGNKKVKGVPMQSTSLLAETLKQAFHGKNQTKTQVNNIAAPQNSGSNSIIHKPASSLTPTNRAQYQAPNRAQNTFNNIPQYQYGNNAQYSMAKYTQDKPPQYQHINRAFNQHTWNRYQQINGAQYQRNGLSKYQQNNGVQYQGVNGAQYQNGYNQYYPQNNVANYQRNNIAKYQQNNVAKYQRNNVGQYQQNNMAKYQQNNMAKYQQNIATGSQYLQNQRLEQLKRTNPLAAYAMSVNGGENAGLLQVMSSMSKKQLRNPFLMSVLMSEL